MGNLWSVRMKTNDVELRERSLSLFILMLLYLKMDFCYLFFTRKLYFPNFRCRISCCHPSNCLVLLHTSKFPVLIQLFFLYNVMCEDLILINSIASGRNRTNNLWAICYTFLGFIMIKDEQHQIISICHSNLINCILFCICIPWFWSQRILMPYF